MQTPNIYIIGFPNKGIEADTETADGINFLFDKYKARGSYVKSLVVKITRSGNFKSIEKLAERNTPQPGEVGVYLIFHTGGGYARLFRKQYGKEAPNSDLANQVCEVLVDYGITHMKKLCLVSCNTAQQRSYPAGEANVLNAFCQAVQQSYQPPPMIAGWDSFVTITEGGHKSVDSHFRTPMQKSQRLENKKIKIFERGKWVDRLYNQGWSNKEMVEVHYGNPRAQNDTSCCLLGWIFG